MKRFRVVLPLLLLVSLSVPIRTVHADVAPPPAPQLGGLEPFEYEDTNVQMVYERVEMEVQSFIPEDGDPDFPQGRIDVTAYFTMRNWGETPESMQAVFPLENMMTCEASGAMGNSYSYYAIVEDSFTVMIDGSAVPTEQVVTGHPHPACDEMEWAGFDVTFPVQQDVVIRVQYTLESLGLDVMQNIEYILETGAGWAGPIQRGYVIVKFPYAATSENVLAESTPGYQFLYNEVFWSFENLEPASENNIQISIVSPATWQEILSLKQAIQQDPKQPEKWLQLTQTYFDIATWHYDNVRSEQYYDRLTATYEQAIAANPGSAELHAKYAEFQLYQISPRLVRELTEEEAGRVLPLLSRALSLDPNNMTARMILSDLQGVAPFLTYTPPATLRPSPTSQVTRTPIPDVSPTSSLTPIPSLTPVVVTVVHTKIVTQRPVNTSTPGVELTPSAIVTPDSDEDETVPFLPVATVGMIATLIAGFIVGILWPRRNGKRMK